MMIISYMSVFVSPQDYTTSIESCIKVSYAFCNHNYSLWCKKNKIEQVNYIVEKITPIFENILSKNQGSPFDKILFMSIIEYLSKKEDDKYKKIEKKQEEYSNDSQTQTELSQESIIKSNEYITLKNELEQTKKTLEKDKEKHLRDNKQNQETLIKLLNLLNEIKTNLDLINKEETNNTNLKQPNNIQTQIEKKEI